MKRAWNPHDYFFGFIKNHKFRENQMKISLSMLHDFMFTSHPKRPQPSFSDGIYRECRRSISSPGMNTSMRTLQSHSTSYWESEDLCEIPAWLHPSDFVHEKLTNYDEFLWIKSWFNGRYYCEQSELISNSLEMRFDLLTFYSGIVIKCIISRALWHENPFILHARCLFEYLCRQSAFQFGSGMLLRSLKA